MRGALGVDRFVLAGGRRALHRAGRDPAPIIDGEEQLRALPVAGQLLVGTAHTVNAQGRYQLDWNAPGWLIQDLDLRLTRHADSAAQRV